MKERLNALLVPRTSHTRRPKCVLTCLWHIGVLRRDKLVQGEATLAATRAQTMLGRLS